MNVQAIRDEFEQWCKASHCKRGKGKGALISLLSCALDADPAEITGQHDSLGQAVEAKQGAERDTAAWQSNCPAS